MTGIAVVAARGGGGVMIAVARAGEAVFERLALPALLPRFVPALLLVVVDPVRGAAGGTANVLVLVIDSPVLASGAVPALLMLLVLPVVTVLVAALLLPHPAVASAAPISRAAPKTFRVAVRLGRFGMGSILAR